MYTVLQVAAVCTQLFAQQQARQETYNNFVYNSRDMPLYAVNTLPVTVMARRAQLRYEKHCQ